MLQLFLYAVGAIVVFGVLGWLINIWVTSDMGKKIAWSALAVVAVVLFLMAIGSFGGAGGSHVPSLR